MDRLKIAKRALELHTALLADSFTDEEIGTICGAIMTASMKKLPHGYAQLLFCVATIHTMLGSLVDK